MTKNLAGLKRRYERDPIEVQIGGLASNLSRLAWFIKHPDAAQDLSGVFRESKYFAEWAAQHAPLEVQGVLAEVQIEVALWERMSAQGTCPPEQPEAWAQRLLQMSGLLPA